MKQIIFILVLLNLALCQDQQSSEPSAPKLKEQKDRVVQSVDPIAIDPVVVNPTNNNPSQQKQQIDKSSGNVKIDDTIVNQGESIDSINKQKKQETKTQNMNPDPRVNRQVNPNAEVERKAVEMQRARLQQEKRLQYERQKKMKEAHEKKKQSSKQRSQKYKAEQKRLQQLRQRQKAYEQRKKKMQMNQKTSYTVDDDQKRGISQTQRVRMNQINAFRQLIKDVPLNLVATNIIFEINNQIQQYILRPSTVITMFLRFTIYKQKNNVYGYIDDVSQSRPVKIYVYEDNNRIVGQLSVYFQGAIKFQAKANSTYIVRVYNSGQPKLVSFDYPSFVTSDAANKMVTSDMVNVKVMKTKTAVEEIRRSMQTIQQSKLLDITNVNYLSSKMSMYFTYHIFECIAFIGLCFGQIYLIKKLFGNSSIL